MIVSAICRIRTQHTAVHHCLLLPLLLLLLQVGDGLTDFRPTPEESRALIAAGYSCPATLLVRFENDNFDETPEMQQILNARFENLSSSNSGSGTSTPTVMEADAAAAAAAATAAADAWSSIDEDIDIDRVLQQLQQLQQPQQGWQQQQQQQQPPGLQSMLLPGSHVTPCGAQVTRGNEQNSSSSELKNLSNKVLGWLESARRAGLSSRSVAAPVSRQPVAAAAAAAAGSSGAQMQDAAAAAAVPAAVEQL
jgi:hypothetical protein